MQVFLGQKYAEELHRKKSSHNMNPLSELGTRPEAGFFMFQLSFKLEWTTYCWQNFSAILHGTKNAPKSIETTQ